MENIRYILNDLSGIENEVNVPAKRLCTFKAGGDATVVFYPKNTEELKNLTRYFAERDIKYTVIGRGANTIISDDGVLWPLISLKNFDRLEIFGNNITAGAGVMNTRLARFAEENSLSGLEFVFGIPSTVGGLVRMNAGAFGREINDVLVSCEILTPAGEVELLKPKMSYRFSEIDGIVLSATFVLDYLESHEISSEIKRLTALRMEKQPQEPSCGSVFKAHQNESAAKFIEATGLKGMRIGGAQISPKHCNFIVNLGGATTKDFMELCEKVEETVYYEFGIKLEREFKYLGET